jgi:hypothetical protein
LAGTKRFACVTLARRILPLTQYRNRGGGTVRLRLDPDEIVALCGFLALGSHFAAVVSGESSQFSPYEVGTYTAAVSTDSARTLIDKISVAAVAIHNRTRNEPEMKIPKDCAPLPDGGHYREVAGNLRLVARQCNFPIARQEILNLAMRYEQRAHHFDTRTEASMPDPPASC